jgi:DedD protein
MAEQDTSPDADLHLKKRARRRLVGAVALALLAVIVLPMVMDREPRPSSQDIQVRIPSQDSTGFTAKVLQGKAAVTPMPAPEVKPAPVPEPLVEPKVVDAKAKPEPTVAKAASSPPATPVAKPAEKSTAPEKALEAVDKTVPDASGQWVVQLGAYKEAGNVKVLLSKLKGVGVPAYTEKFESPQGPRTRVRAGPFASQDAAEMARSKIKIVGVDGPVAQK